MRLPDLMILGLIDQSWNYKIICQQLCKSMFDYILIPQRPF